MKCSVCLSTRNKSSYLRTTLGSIFRQRPQFDFEVVVVDDGSTDNTGSICNQYPVIYRHLKNPRYRNPSVARNVAFKLATGEVLLAQSDDIIHVENNTIEYLVTNLQEGEFLLARTHGYDYKDGKPVKFIREYCGPDWQKPYFFLGAILRKHVYAIGGYDEEFIEPCWDDNWFADCLMKGLGLQCRFTERILAHHQTHIHEKGGHRNSGLSKNLYERKSRVARHTNKWVNSGGSWLMEQCHDS